MSFNTSQVNTSSKSVNDLFGPSPTKFKVIQNVNISQIKNKDLIRSLDDFILVLGDKIGEGTFGEVWNADYIYKGKEYKNVAVKILAIKNEKSIEEFENEINIIQKLGRSPYVATIYDYFVVNSNDMIYGYIIMEKLDSKFLFNHFKVLNGLYGDDWFDAVINVMIQLLNGLSYIHSKNVIHGDIKHENILYNGKNLVFTDFGLSCYKICSPSFRGSVLFADPNLYLTYGLNLNTKKAADFESDIYSLGVVFYEMIGNKQLFFKPPQSKEQYINFYNSNMKLLIFFLQKKKITNNQTILLYNILSNMINPFETKQPISYYISFINNYQK